MTPGSWPQRHPLLAYFGLTYVISLGGIALVVGATGFDLVNLRPLDTGLIFVSMLLGPSVSGLAMTARLEGRPGLHRLWSSLARWQVGARWYALALLIMPVLFLAVLCSFAAFLDPAFTPRFQWPLFAIGLLAGSFEEVGWTGFATPRLLARQQLFIAGLSLGLGWALWHALVDFRQNFNTMGFTWLLEYSAAHALVAMGMPSAARNFLQTHAREWDRCSSFMLTHNWWHLALCDLDLGNLRGALASLDERVWGVRKGHAQDQVNAISLLARLEMHGVRAAWRWDDIARHLEGRIDDRISDFLDLHYLYALARSGRDSESDHLVEAMRGKGIVSALAVGIVAHARSDYRKAAEAIAPVVRRLGLIGGSNIQRELFVRIYNDSVKRMHTPDAIHVTA